MLRHLFAVREMNETISNRNVRQTGGSEGAEGGSRGWREGNVLIRVGHFSRELT